MTQGVALGYRLSPLRGCRGKVKIVMRVSIKAIASPHFSFGRVHPLHSARTAPLRTTKPRLPGATVIQSSVPVRPPTTLAYLPTRHFFCRSLQDLCPDQQTRAADLSIRPVYPACRSPHFIARVRRTFHRAPHLDCRADKLPSGTMSDHSYRAGAFRRALTVPSRLTELIH